MVLRMSLLKNDFMVKPRGGGGSAADHHKSEGKKV